MTEQQFLAEIRQIPLVDRLIAAKSMIGKMCSEGRPPKMSIPVRAEDEDFFICTTLNDAIAAIGSLQADQGR